MANHTYILSETLFFDGDAQSRAFVADTGIDVDQPCTSTIPTQRQICDALVGAECVVSRSGRLEIAGSHSDGRSVIFIFQDADDDDSPVAMFELGRESHPLLAIDVLKRLGGKFLLYCDSGAMSLIAADRTTQSIWDDFIC